MTTRKKTTTGKTPVKKLKLKRETIKDLGSKKSGAVKGGLRNKDTNDICTAVCSVGCDPSLVFCKPTR